MTHSMGPLEAAVAIVLALIAAWTSWIGLRKRETPKEEPAQDPKPDTPDTRPAPLRHEDIEYIRDPGTKALALAVDMSERLSRVEDQNDALAKENRDFRDVVLGVIHRLERMPPYTAADILAYIQEHLPFFRTALPDLTERIPHDPPR